MNARENNIINQLKNLAVLRSLKKQLKNDELKCNYEKNKGIPLIEIPYTHKKYEKVIEYLKLKSVIKNRWDLKTILEHRLKYDHSAVCEVTVHLEVYVQ